MAHPSTNTHALCERGGVTASSVSAIAGRAGLAAPWSQVKEGNPASFSPLLTHGALRRPSVHAGPPPQIYTVCHQDGTEHGISQTVV